MLNRQWKNMDKRFSGAVCIPASCSGSEIIPKLMQNIFIGRNLTLSKDDFNQDDFCQTREKKSLKAVDYLAM